MPSLAESRAKILGAVNSADPIGGLLPPAANSFRLSIRTALRARREVRFPSLARRAANNQQQPPQGGGSIRPAARPPSPDTGTPPLLGGGAGSSNSRRVLRRR